jgi:hypothetical protein
MQEWIHVSGIASRPLPRMADSARLGPIQWEASKSKEGMNIYTEAKASPPPGLVTGDYVPLGVEEFNKAYSKFLHVLAGLQPEDPGFEPGRRRYPAAARYG